MHQDDETTATQLQAILARHQVYVSLATIVRNRRELGWVYRGSAYCQLICSANKEKRLDFVHTYLHDNFDVVIWSDETTVQLETHKRMATGKKERSLAQNLKQNIRSRSTCGEGSAGKEQLPCIFLKGL